jgi:hypothetical protein
MLHNYPLLASHEAYLAHHVSKNGEAFLTHVKQNMFHMWLIVLHLRQLSHIVCHIWLCAGTNLQWVPVQYIYCRTCGVRVTLGFCFIYFNIVKSWKKGGLTIYIQFTRKAKFRFQEDFYANKILFYSVKLSTHCSHSHIGKNICRQQH